MSEVSVHLHCCETQAQFSGLKSKKLHSYKVLLCAWQVSMGTLLCGKCIHASVIDAYIKIISS